MNHTLVLEEYENAHPKCLPTFQSKSNHVLGVKDVVFLLWVAIT